MSDSSHKRKESSDRALDDLDNALDAARNYPRKRVAVACEVCRLRKTRCDAKRPSCSFCIESGAQCVYRQLAPPEKHSTASDVLQRIDDRLARLEDCLQTNRIRSEAGDTPSSNRRSSVDTLPSHLRQRHPTEDWRNYFQAAVSFSHHEFSFRQTAVEAATARPSLTSFKSPYYIQFESWDDTEGFYDDEMAAEEQLYRAMDTHGSHSPSLRSRNAWRLQQTFVKNYLQWMPLVDVEVFVEHFNVAQSGGFAENNPSSCLIMFAFAYAELSEDKGAPYDERYQTEFLPGLNYFRRGNHILNQLPLWTRKEIEVLQCRLVNAAYLKLNVRPLMAWNVLMEVGRDCMHILSSGHYRNMNKSQRESFYRVFWICSIALHELESILKMHPMGIRQFHEIVPLPLAETEEDGFYYFFAQASLRKLLTETLDVVGYKIGQVIYAPVIASELRKQASEWYEHLPPPIRFPINSSHLFDLRKSFLRMQFVAMQCVILWPSMLQYLESSVTEKLEGPSPSDRVQTLRNETRDFVEYCILTLDLAEEMLMQRHLGLEFSLWSTYAILSQLLIAYRAPALDFLPEARNDVYIRKAFSALRTWEHLSIVRRGLDRLRVQMQKAQIPVDEYIPRR